ncbi:MAG: hypothetical protein P8N02_11125, partial [Actinomycetota bacterium]|nr:hypothetical protein [Actinomycetota bacterium]
MGDPPMTEIGLSPQNVLQLSERLRTQASAASHLADEVDRALRLSGLSSTVPLLLDEESSRWSHTSQVLVERTNLATSLTLDLHQGAAGALTPELEARRDRLLTLLADVRRLAPSEHPNLLARFVTTAIIAMLVGRMSPAQLHSVLASLDSAQRIALIEALADHPEAVQRIAQALPSPLLASDGRSALMTLRDHLSLIELAAGQEIDGRLEYGDLAAALDNFSLVLPPWLARTVASLRDQPVWFSNIAGVNSTGLTTEAEGRGHLDSDTIAMALLQTEAVVLLSDRRLFDRLDSIGNGDRDGLVSESDIRRALDTGAITGPTAATLLAFVEVKTTSPSPYLPSGPTGFERFEVGRPGPDDGGGDFDGLLSYDDVVAGVVNLHVFADDAVAARRFVLDLDATFDDLSGFTAGYSMRAHSDDGVRSLAAA